MHANQKVVVAVAAAAVLGMLLFPPFHLVRAAVTLNAGYSFLLFPPGKATVDFATLALQWVGTLIVAAAAYFVVPPPRQIASATNASDQRSNTKKKAAQWLVRIVGIIAMLFVYMLILGVGKEAGRFGKQAAQPAPAAVDWSQFTPAPPSQSPTTGREYDVEGARKAGLSDAVIAEYLAHQSGYDLEGARKAGYSDSEIIAHLVGAKLPPSSEIQAGSSSGGAFDKYVADQANKQRGNLVDLDLSDDKSKK